MGFRGVMGLTSVTGFMDCILIRRMGSIGFMGFMGLTGAVGAMVFIFCGFVGSIGFMGLISLSGLIGFTGSIFGRAGSIRFMGFIASMGFIGWPPTKSVKEIRAQAGEASATMAVDSNEGTKEPLCYTSFGTKTLGTTFMR